MKDIAAHLPHYDESLVPVTMNAKLRDTYRALEAEAKRQLDDHQGNRSVLSTVMHTLLLYPDHPFGFGTLYATKWDKEQRRKVRFVLLQPEELSGGDLYPKESALIQDIRRELAEGRRCQVYAVYTKCQQRLKEILEKAGFPVAHLTVKVRPSQREAWYAKRAQEGVEVVLAHPKLVETGLDLLDFPTFYFYEAGHSLPVMRQASRRSYRIGQRLPVRVKFLVYTSTTQDMCLRLMFKKKLVALTIEGQFCGEGLEHGEDDESDILAAVARGLMKQDIGETAEEAWRTLRETEAALETAGLIGNSGSGTENDAAEPPYYENGDDAAPPWPLPDTLGVALPDPALIFSQTPESYSRTRRRARTENPAQGSLF